MNSYAAPAAFTEPDRIFEIDGCPFANDGNMQTWATSIQSISEDAIRQGSGEFGGRRAAIDLRAQAGRPRRLAPEDPRKYCGPEGRPERRRGGSHKDGSDCGRNYIRKLR